MPQAAPLPAAPAPTRRGTLTEILLYPSLLTPFIITIPLMVSVLLSTEPDPELRANPFEVILLHIGGTLLGLMLQCTLGLLLHTILRRFKAPLPVYGIVGTLACFFGWIAVTGVWIDPFSWYMAAFGLVQGCLTHYFANRTIRLKGLAALKTPTTP